MHSAQPRLNPKTISDPAYNRLVDVLVAARKEKTISQADLAAKMLVHQSFVAKVETKQRRLDLLEYVRWMIALGEDPLPPVKMLADAQRGRRRRALLTD